MHPHRWSPEFYAAFSRPDIREVMERLLGGPIHGLQTTYYFGHPGTGGFANHQDNFFVEAASWAFASAWIALTDVDRENGGLYAYPGAHMLPRLPVAAVSRPHDPNQDPNAYNEECIMPPGYRPVDTVVPKGAVLFLHGQLPHGSHDNRSTRPRSSLLCTFVRQGAPFRSGIRSKRVAVDLSLPFAPARQAS
jgi:phytanoyl-CoA hydroxylase